jgi:ABC-type polysaccharide/polyol phosphate export permease
MPIAFHVMRMLQRNLIIFAHNAVTLAAIWPFVPWRVGLTGLLSLAGVLLLYLFLAGVSMVISVVCVRYRDVPPLVQVAVQFLFFVTPVIWTPEQLRFGRMLLDLNPIAYMLMLVRDPVLGRSVTPMTLAAAVIFTAASLSVGILIYIRFRNRIAYWV